MNSKVLIGVVGIVVVVAAVFFLSNRSSQSVPGPTVVNTQPQNVIQDATVTVTSTGFSPSTLTVKAGTRVIWSNKSGKTVTVNSANHPTHQLYSPLNLGEFNNGSSVQLTFDKPGTYQYHNHLNPSQTGSVVVQ